MCRSLAASKINLKEVVDVSFVGKQVCAMLTKLAYAPTLINKLVSRGGTISHIESYGPLYSENLKKSGGRRGKTPGELLMNRTAYTIVFCGSIHTGGYEV